MISVLTAVSQKRPNDGVPLEICLNGRRQETNYITDIVCVGWCQLRWRKIKQTKGTEHRAGPAGGGGSILSKGDRHSPARVQRLRKEVCTPRMGKMGQEKG